ncbi:hypothetical protein SNEBB_009116, partial [Seison nebaliae]
HIWLREMPMKILMILITIEQSNNGYWIKITRRSFIEYSFRMTENDNRSGSYVEESTEEVFK